MKIFALFTWILAASAGLYLFAIWLIEYDRDFQRSLATRLPVPVISAHAVLAAAGLTLWVSNFILDQARLVWAARSASLSGIL
jgi:manganese efflux pump family protein